MALLDEEGAFVGYPQLQRQAARMRAAAQGRIPENLPDPRTYGFVSGLLGTSPDELGMSVLSPNTQAAKEAAYYGYQLGNAGQIAPAAVPVARTLGRGLMTLGPSEAAAMRNPMSQMGGVTTSLKKNTTRSPYPQEQALLTAQENAATLGQSAKQETRMLQQGYYPDWYHGSTGDITNFRPDLLGEATGAASAKKAYFFARDPQNPPAGLLQKTTDQESIDLLKRLGKTDEEIAALNAVSMKGNAAQTASGYAQIGGSREYREAMRKANSAEKRGDWNEYEKQMQIAEDSEINRMNYAQGLVAKYGDARDQMLETIKNTIYSKKLSQE